MNKLTIAMLISLIICMAASVISNAKEVERMTDKIIRVHVIANSDSEGDQELKLKVKDRVVELAGDMLAGCSDKDEAASLIKENLDDLCKAAEEVISSNGYQYGVVCSISPEVFETRIYDDFTLPAGEYDSLCIRIGEAEGTNWWCVCYPSLCIGSASKIDDCGAFTEGEITIVKEPEKVRYKLWCFKLMRKIKAIFE